jgi:hypothetical protein
MLISGVWVCVDKCDDNRQATSGIDLHFTPPDSLR